MKITLISHDDWGFNRQIADELERKGHVVTNINFSNFKYKYPNFSYKIYNFFLKALLKKNLKNIHFGKKIIEHLKENKEKQDIILTIKGDFIDPENVLEFKKFTNKSIAYFNDNIYRCPKIIRVIPNFDEVFSFEKEDCEKYNLKFITNWIYTPKLETKKEFDYQIFNISSKDKRFPVISKIAADLKLKGIVYKIMVFDKKMITIDPNIEFISKHIQISEVNDYINAAKLLLDISRKEQKGLTFRVFESLGLGKKLITTNSDIKNYDFYNPNNILIISEENPIIPIDFFNNEYKDIPEFILKKYTLSNWVDVVFR
jgi:hypothetical protein